jgi:DNA polymerase elongation subunit (family B)
MTTYVLDTECYKDFFLIAFRDIDTGVTYCTQLCDGQDLVKELPCGTYLTFNGLNYDFPIISLAFAGADNATLKAASDDIILNGLKPWHIRDKYGGVDLSGVDHIDLIEVAPGQVGLKIYGGRLHSKRLQDLPIEPSASISVADRQLLIDYCGNDLLTTLDLYNQLKPQLALRESMSAEFGIDLRSKSDAQIAEAVIRSEVEKLIGRRVYRPDVHPAYRFNYKAPEWVSFASEGMNNLLRIVQECDFSLDDKGSVVMPTILESMRLRIGSGVYRMGVGGLHSSESCVAHMGALTDRDVASYYPQIILNNGYKPSHLGDAFLTVYRSLVERRLEAKRTGDKVMADALKIVVNGSFGKFGSKWSILYAPDLLIQVTITGQLALLMLIEALTEAGFEVVSANTDGVVIKNKDGIDALMSAWEIVTQFTTEATEYTSLYSRDVNNYIAVKPDGSTKLKGAYAPAGMSKNTTNQICVDAVVNFLANNVPIETTICNCTDPRKFVTIRQVKGGAMYGAEYLGKAVRWYYALGETRHISYQSNGNKVARSEGCRPLMELPDVVPHDIDFEWYVSEANSILRDVGY